MVATKSYKEHADTHLINRKPGFNLLKSAVIYGNNASGKSNFVEAFTWMKLTVKNSFRDALVEMSQQIFPQEKFALNTSSVNKPSFFEVSFIWEGVQYRYGFEVDNGKIVAEWLFHTAGKEVALFKRSFQEFDINKTSFKEGLEKYEDVKDTVLFVSYLATIGKEISSKIVKWFDSVVFINGLLDTGHKRLTIDKLKNDKAFLNWVQHFVSYLEITSVSTSESDFDFNLLDKIKKQNMDETFVNLLTSLQKFSSSQPKADQLVTYHRQYDENNMFVGTVPFKFDEQESNGTQKLLYLLGPWYDALRNGKVLVVDELDCRLHVQLTQRLINFFHQYNRKNAQLISVVHDVNLLKKEIFRRDQVYFIEKDQFGVSSLYSLSDFKAEQVRSKSAYNKNYLEGDFGAVPYFTNDEQLATLLYGEEQE